MQHQRRAVANGIAVALITLAATAPARAAEPYVFEDALTAGERDLAGRAMQIIEQECPPLRPIDWREAGAVIEVGRPSDPFANMNPLWARYGWTASIGFVLDVGPELRAVAISAGAGPDGRPGIASRTGGGYAGAEICRLDEWEGDHSFREVPDLGFVQQLGEPPSAAERP